MLDTIFSLGAIALAAIFGSRVFNAISRRYGQTLAFVAMLVLLGLAFAIQTYLE